MPCVKLTHTCTSQFVWYHYQMAVKRALRGNSQRIVNPHIVLNADGDDVDEHAAQLREQWNMLREQVLAPLRLQSQLHLQGISRASPGDPQTPTDRLLLLAGT